MLTAQDIKGYNLFIGLDESELSAIAALFTRQTFERNSVTLARNLLQ